MRDDEPRDSALFSKPRRKVVLRLLCEKLAELIRQDENLVEKIISAAKRKPRPSNAPMSQRSSGSKNR